MSESGALLQQIPQLGRIGSEAMLGTLSSNIDFQKRLQFFAERLGGDVQSLGQADGIERINGGEKFCCLVALIRLQVPDQVPARVGKIMQACGLGSELLHPVFAKDPDSSLVSLFDAR